MQPIPYFGEKLEGEWIVEPKVDGWRMQVLCTPQREIQFWGRRLERTPHWTRKLSYLIPYVEKLLPPGTILDTELYSTGGRRFIPSLFASSPKVEPIIYVFDVIFWENQFVGNFPLKERKEIIGKIPFSSPFFLIEYWTLKENLRKEIEKALKEGHEGIVIKRLSSLYRITPEGPIATLDWRKIKS